MTAPAAEPTGPFPDMADAAPTGPTVAVVGSANADAVITLVRRPGPGETVAGGDVATHPGGKGANQAVAAALAGARVAFCGCVGDDAAGALLLASLKKAGADVARVAQVDRPTGQAMILVTPDGENSIVVSPGANGEVTPAYAETCRDVWQRAAVVVLNLEIPLDTVRLVALGTTARVVLNVAPAAEVDDPLLAVCDPLVVNEHEARVVLGVDETGGIDEPDDTTEPDRTDDFEPVARQLLARGARSVVVTLGARGAIVADPSGTTTVPAHPVDAVDTTGAGDAFVGALAARLAEGDDLPTAARYAAATAALSVQAVGAQTSYPRREEVLRLSRSGSSVERPPG